MKRFFGKLGIFAFAATLFVGCSEDRVSYAGPDYVMFSDSLQTIAIQNSETYYDIPISATTACDYDRTYAVEVVDKGSNAIEGLHYELQSNSVTIKAGELASSVKVKGFYDNFEDTDSLGINLRLVAPQDKIWNIYGDETKVQLVKICPFDVQRFVGYAKVTSNFFADYMPNTSFRVVTVEQDPEKENGVIINDFFLDGMDLKISFNTQKPLDPKVEMETQAVTKLSEVTGGAVLGTDMILAVAYTGVASYFNVCQGFALLYHTFYVEGYESAGPIGTYPTVVEWISPEEYDYLKKQGY